MRQLFFFINDSPLETGPNWIGFFSIQFLARFFSACFKSQQTKCSRSIFLQSVIYSGIGTVQDLTKSPDTAQIIAFGASCPAFRFSFSGCPLPAPPAACYWPITTLVDRPCKPTFSGLQGHFCPSNNTMFERRYRDVNRS